MSSEKTMAIVIRLVEFSESSYVATVFTEGFGKITALAKGARRTKSSFENALDLLAVSRVVFIRKSSTAMDLLTEARLERPFRAASRDLTRLYAGYYVAEILQAMTDDRDPHPELFRRANQTLLALSGNDDVGVLVLGFELATLRELGHLPAFSSCVECGTEVELKRNRVSFGQLAGGVLCGRCKVGKRQVVSVSSQAMQALVQLADPDRTSESINLETKVRGELRGLLNSYFSHLLGRRPRMHGFLTRLR
ncbi:MAG: DNA repair protein RecO [Pirellulaceae bacterium]|nr:DNA repair protein RecO [Pirellulaceae bacterium]